jgi:hypothetical protein
MIQINATPNINAVLLIIHILSCVSRLARPVALVALDRAVFVYRLAFVVRVACAKRWFSGTQPVYVALKFVMEGLYRFGCHEKRVGAEHLKKYLAPIFGLLFIQHLVHILSCVSRLRTARGGFHPSINLKYFRTNTIAAL